MSEIDFENFRIKTLPTGKMARQTALPRHAKGENFFAGPIPWTWWAPAARLPGKSLQVATAIWHIGRLKNSRTIQLQGKVLNDLGVSRKSVNRVLRALERGNLISCDRGAGRRAVITILDAPRMFNGNGKESSMKGDS